MNRTARRGGFTLVELLVVIVIIGILAAIGVNKFWAAKDRSYRAGMMSDLKNLATHQEAYFGLNMTYATVPTDLNNYSTTAGVTVTINSADTGGFAAEATHVSVAGVTCGLFMGNADPAGAVPATTAGQVTCQ